MKKIIISIVMLLIMAAVLSGCGCKHTWTEASCITAKTCTLCSAVEGETLGHNWMEATCDTPRTCATCSLTEGEALGHDWQAATCTAPKTCAACNRVDGVALGHTCGGWICNEEQFEYSCKVCGEEQNLSPEEFFLELLAGEWKALLIPNVDRGETVTFHEDGTADMSLASKLVCPDTVRMIAGDLFYVESSNNWGMHYYLEDYLAEGQGKLDPEHGLYLLVTVREDRQEDGTVVLLQHKGYECSWILVKQ